MKMELLKNSLLILFILFCVNCKKNENTFEYLDFSKLENSHEIFDKDLNDSLNFFLNSDFNKYDFDYPILILDIEKSEKEVIFHFCKTDFIVFKNYRNEYFKEPYGFLNYGGFPLLLFGNYDDNYINTKQNFNIDKILGDLPVYDRDNPPITYDPNFLSFKIGNASD